METGNPALLAHRPLGHCARQEKGRLGARLGPATPALALGSGELRASRWQRQGVWEAWAHVGLRAVSLCPPVLPHHRGPSGTQHGQDRATGMEAEKGGEASGSPCSQRPSAGRRPETGVGPQRPNKNTGVLNFEKMFRSAKVWPKLDPSCANPGCARGSQLQKPELEARPGQSPLRTPGSGARGRACSHTSLRSDKAANTMTRGPHKWKPRKPRKTADSLRPIPTTARPPAALAFATGTPLFQTWSPDNIPLLLSPPNSRKGCQENSGQQLLGPETRHGGDSLYETGLPPSHAADRASHTTMGGFSTAAAQPSGPGSPATWSAQPGSSRPDSV